jgi:hypothetical protein
MVSCKATFWYRGYYRIAIGIAVGGGVFMFFGAIVAHGSASIPLLVIGGGWLLGGLLSIWQSSRTVQEIILNCDSVEFRSRAKRLTIPATEIVEVNRPWWDTGHMAYLRFRTRSDGNIKAVPRFEGFLDFLVELRRLNPEVKVNTL